METVVGFENVAWRKSSASNLGNCVEVTTAPVNGVIGVRDTKDRDGVILAFSVPVWGDFLADAKMGAWAKR
ncbi:DUF397 domain-containing protein [Cryptosporangium sp. NPDC048952]|uniref:DUF397 domain-containing protein n=1 Tax=Cryptosporangium sp. NPDC048952 TaxID=3363961 RepID=UPI00371535D5